MKIKRLWPIFIILIVMIGIYTSGFWKYLSFDNLKKNKFLIEQYVVKYPVRTPIIYMLIYIFITIICIPGSLILTLIGGFLWPQPFSTLFVLIGATIGASILFLAARYAFRDYFEKQTGHFLEKMRHGFDENQISYLLFLRLVPLFPFWIVNLAPAFFHVRFIHYIWTTFVGIAPGSFVIAQMGQGLNQVLDSDQGFTISAFFNFQMNIALVGLAVISLIPILIKKWHKRKNKHD